MRLNGTKKASLIGFVVIGLLAVFAFLNGIPWATKSDLSTVKASVTEVKSDFQREMSGMRDDIRQIRDILLRMERR